jgi:hypothetical protein
MRSVGQASAAALERWLGCLSRGGSGLLPGSSAACREAIRDENDPQSSPDTHSSAAQLFGRERLQWFNQAAPYPESR